VLAPNSAFTRVLTRYGGGFLGGGEVVVDGEHLGALLGEPQHRGAAVAHPLAWRLAGAHDDGDLVLETHAAPRVQIPHAQLMKIRRRKRVFRPAH